MNSSAQSCVLIVEDEDSIRLTLRLRQEQGYNVIAVDGVGR
jgi:hypothetical protein